LFFRDFEIFRSDFGKNIFVNGVFELFIQRNCQKHDKNQSKEKTTWSFGFPQTFWQKAFDMDSPQNVFYGVFELPLLRNAQKRHKKGKIKLYLPGYLLHLVAICQIYVAFNYFVLKRPLFVVCRPSFVCQYCVDCFKQGLLRGAKLARATEADLVPGGALVLLAVVT
jgi:hypothetical protein